MHILIVEDEFGIIQFLQQGLEEEGYKITTAADGEIAIQLLKSNTFDLILLDWMLPKKSGLEVCLFVRETDQQTPIIFLTAKDTVQETIEGLNAGANDYIKKPFSFEELVARIKVHFRSIPVQNELKLGTITLNLTNHTVHSNTEEITFTQREFNLLAFLIKNKGKVCTRNEILEVVWDIHFEYDTGVIDVFINAIRKKLRLSVENDLIKTIRGVGYIVEDKQ